MTNRLNDRQKRIFNILNTEGEVKISNLNKLFEVTEMTIRRDLEKLESEGFAKRTLGGAIFFSKDIAYLDRTSYMTDEKAKIGKKAAEFIQSGDSIFLDGGTTTNHVARYLESDQDLKVVTNALNIGNDMIGRNISTIVLGGILLESTSSLVGAITAQAISDMAFDRIFIGATGVSPIHGFSNSNMYEAEIKRVAIQKASEVNIVVDHSKFDAKELFSFAKLSEVNRIITDKMPGEELKQFCMEAEVEIIVVD